MTQGMHLMFFSSCSSWHEVIMRARIETGYSFTATNKPTWLKGGNGNNEKVCFIISSPNPEADAFSLTLPLNFWWLTRCHKHMDKTSQRSNRRQIQTMETPCQRLNTLSYKSNATFSVSYKQTLFKWLPCKYFPHTQTSVVFSRFL